ncbi:MAG: anti-sigma factor [Streptosporangiales bacterium]|nr:anti-sigma factor [Streptosporangiales bacterium]
MSGEQHEEATDQRCIELVELLTAYLDDALTDDIRTQFEEHLEGCAGCQAALAQWRTVAGLAGRLSAEDVANLDPYVRDRLMATLVIPRRR